MLGLKFNFILWNSIMELWSHESNSCYLLLSKKFMARNNHCFGVHDTPFAKNFDMNKIFKIRWRGRKEVDVGDLPC